MGKASITGEIDPEGMMDIGLDMLENKVKGKRAYSENSLDYRQMNDNPYQAYLTQLLKKYPQQIEQPQIEQPQKQMEQQISIDSEKDIYNSGEIDDKADNIKITKSPYEHKDGDINGLLGAGLKKKRGRKKKSIDKVEIVKKLPHQKFTHSPNSSLDQLIEGTQEKQEKKDKQNMRNMVDKQTKLLTVMGFGVNSNWINHVKEYSKKHNISYKQALKEAKKTYKKN